ncbi:MAG: hypothetical protein J3K34DRAFT_41396 [Monoraphidium minutum]|nr:MAG: hypothetical protein J3K34DRAFT_41396 [Monoraphidium minutum]
MSSLSPFSELAVQATSELLPLEPQDLQHATALCEAVYSQDDAAARRELDELAGLMGMGPGTALSRVTLHDAAGQRYIVGHAPHTMYVGFQGTKHVRDWVANLSFRHSTMWNADDSAKPPAAHGGFSGRSVAVPLEELYEQALSAGKRMVLCGHSLGGAVALLCTIKLLRIWAARQLGGSYAAEGGGVREAVVGAPGAGGGAQAPRSRAAARREKRARQQARSAAHIAAAAAAAAAAPFADPRIRCITFAAPAVANESLAAEVVAAGWDRLMSNFVQPGAARWIAS